MKCTGCFLELQSCTCFNEMNILEEAIKAVTGDRCRDYGHALDNHQRIADFWAIYKGVMFTAEDVANMMILMKVAREMNTHKRDNMVDIAGYAYCVQEMREERIRRDSSRS